MKRVSAFHASPYSSSASVTRLFGVSISAARHRLRLAFRSWTTWAPSKLLELANSIKRSWISCTSFWFLAAIFAKHIRPRERGAYLRGPAPAQRCMKLRPTTGFCIRRRGESAFGLDHRQTVLAWVDEPGRPRMAHVGDAIHGHGIWRRVLLDTHAPSAQIGDGRVDVRHTPCHLGLSIRSADRAEGDRDLRSAPGAKDDPVTRILSQDLEA